ncbi:hypothetical protein BX616_000911, partial [Lobosporangium transversale]
MPERPERQSKNKAVLAIQASLPETQTGGSGADSESDADTFKPTKEKKQSKAPNSKRKRRRDPISDSDSDGHNEDNDGETGKKALNQEQKRKRKKKSVEGIKKGKRLRKDYWSINDKSRAPLMNLVHSLMSQEEKASRTLALMVLDGKQDDETYRWPVREELLPPVPKDIYEDDTDANFFEAQGMEFVEELAGVPKTTDDFLEEFEGAENEEESDDDLDTATDNDMPQTQRMSLHKQKRLEELKERIDNERNANNRLQEIYHLLKNEFSAFAQRQYRKGMQHRVKDFYSFQKDTLPPFRAQAAQSTIGESLAGDEQDDILTPIQENAAKFAAEDALKRILDRLPYVLRQGALGNVPDYVRLGLPKPVSSVADYERGWDTVMAAASISGIEDRILKKVAYRMKSLLSQSRNTKFYETAPKSKPATVEEMLGGTEEVIRGSPIKVRCPYYFDITAQSIQPMDSAPKPLYLSHDFKDPMDP